MKRYKKLKTRVPIPNNPKAVYHEHYTGRELFNTLEIENSMIEDPNGEWVKYEDVGDEIDKVYDIGYRAGYINRPIADQFNPGSGTIKCNCEEEAYTAGFNQNGRSPIRKDYWICPAHGYKKR